ncbi:OsmC family protein [Empedobacter stercoris]|uniref:OsmC family protein n=1 Tax=Empedobacter stercoris TaxID=1628248 RepID=A0ABX1WP21_9FLAO|nr:OsmC family protein [Empedobacter stercoris]MCA4810360.1 OsmC family protein [Empedobacter stercoris]NOJ76447.1 OsmC family protein [Empedobacter stercoris]QNT13559.1 OsmC family protein [Empedobacter stercoris]
MEKTIETIYQGQFTSNTACELNENGVTVNAVHFTPIDLLASAYSSCLLGTIDYLASKNGFQVQGTTSQITYQLDQGGTKVGSMNIKISFAEDYTAEQKEIILAATQNCHVGKSLDPAIVKSFEFVYPQGE